MPSAITYYGISLNGDPRILYENSPESTCKVSKHDNGREYYYIRRNRRGKLYNPLSDGLTTAVRDGFKLWDYYQVSKEVFDLYFEFLKTRKSNYLLQAQRSMI